MQYVIIAQQTEANLDVQATLLSLLCIVLNSKLMRFSFPPHTLLYLFSSTFLRQYLPASLPPSSFRILQHITSQKLPRTILERELCFGFSPSLLPLTGAAQPARLGLAAFAHLLKVKKTVCPSAVKTHSIPYLRQIANLGIQRQKFLGMISDFPDIV